MHLGQRVEGGEVVQGATLPADPCVETLRLGCGLKDAFERLRLELEDPVVVDSAWLPPRAEAEAPPRIPPRLRSRRCAGKGCFESDVSMRSKARARMARSVFALPVG